MILSHKNLGVDFTACDTEEIQFSGAIQPHGLLLVMDPSDLKIVQVSENVIHFIGLRAEDVVGKTIQNFINLNELQLALKNLKETSNYLHFIPQVKLRNSSNLYGAIFHRLNSQIILELEPISIEETHDLLRFYQNVRISTIKLQQVTNYSDCLTLAVLENQKITQFDRVMVYRFHSDDHGEVVAEAKKDELESYLGLHYPASDIPRQARALYLKQMSRIIPNADFIATSIYPKLNPKTNLPLDLGFSTLRSVSKIHCQYLKNMGVKSSMSLSLIQDGRLWGLIAFHHCSPKYLQFEVRSTLESLARTIGWQLFELEKNEGEKKKAINQILVSKIIRRMALSKDPIEGLIQDQNELLSLVRGEGAAALMNGDLKLTGRTPSYQAVNQLIPWIFDHLEGNIFKTDSLSGSYSSGSNFVDSACGILALCVSKNPKDLIIWFKPEAIRTIKWAGDPDQSLSISEVGTLKPRASFELFKQTVHLKSVPWDQIDEFAANELRAAILDIIVSKTDEINQVNTELRAAIHFRDEFLSVASHELKTPLTTLQIQFQLFSSLLRKKPTAETISKLNDRIEIIDKQLDRLNQLIDSLLDVNQGETGKMEPHFQASTDLSKLVDSVCVKFEDEFRRAGSLLVKNIESNVIGELDPLRVEQGVTNLLTNALKYGNSKPVLVTVKRSGESKAQIRVKDHGIGIPANKLGLIFELFTRAREDHGCRGLGIGLWIVKKTVEAQGGIIQVKSSLGKGSTFTIELPLFLSRECKTKEINSDEPIRKRKI